MGSGGSKECLLHGLGSVWSSAAPYQPCCLLRQRHGVLPTVTADRGYSQILTCTDKDRFDETSEALL